MEAARRLLLDYFPGCDPAWFGGEAHGERRIDVFLIGSASEDRVYCVASLWIDGCFVPDVVSEYPHVPYDTARVNAKPPRSAEPGVFASVTQVYPADATAVRFIHRGQVRMGPAIGGWCALFDWDTMWLLGADTPKPEALHIGGSWVPTVSSLAAATPEAFCAAYGAYCDTAGPRGTAPDWAVMSFFEDGTFAEKVHMVECLLDGGLSPDALGCVAAGPVEDLIGHALLDYVTHDATRLARWIPLLRGTYWRSEPPDIQARLRALLTPSGPGATPR